MRNGLFGLFILCGVFIIISSCKKKNEVNPLDNQSMSAVVDGVILTFTGTSIGENTLTLQGPYPSSSYGFTGNQNNTALSIFLPALTVGTYPSGVAQYNPVLQLSQGDVLFYANKVIPPSRGSVIITSTGNGTISGTFSGVLYDATSADSVIITNGQFSNLVYQTPAP